MPRIQVRGNEPGEGWTPLPNGTYNMQIDKVELATTKAGDQQTKVSTHVVDGPNADKKCTIFYSHKPAALWKLVSLFEACGVDYALNETAEVVDGKKQFDFDGDTDELIGCSFVCDVTTRKDLAGLDQNDYVRERAPEGAARPAAAAAPATASALANAPASQPAQTQSAPGRRTVRT